jgi:hypothetical protein
VVRISGMPHPEEEAESDDGKKSDHYIWRPRMRRSNLRP